MKDYICDHTVSCRSRGYAADCDGTVPHQPINAGEDADGVFLCTKRRYCRRGQEWVQCVPVEGGK